MYTSVDLPFQLRSSYMSCGKEKGYQQIIDCHRHKTRHDKHHQHHQHRL